MIARLVGSIIATEEKGLILDVNGVGYQVSVLGSLLAKVGVGQELTLSIYHQISDSAENLFGFENTRDLEFFNLLLTVPSVGPRTALSILDVAPPDTLVQAVVSKDVKLLNKVSGVGKKTAERILVELQEKIKEKPKQAGASGDLQDQTVSALVALGLNKTQAQSLLQKLPSDVKTVEDAVRHALSEKA